MTEKVWRIIGTVHAMATAGLTAAWIVLGVPQDLDDLPLWFQIVLSTQVIVACVIVGMKAGRP